VCHVQGADYVTGKLHSDMMILYRDTGILIALYYDDETWQSVLIISGYGMILGSQWDPNNNNTQKTNTRDLELDA
jgi:hypothetical protein